MAEYSSRSDIRDVLVQGCATEADHQEAEREINRQLLMRGIPLAGVDAESLKELSVAYVCMVRCQYEVRETNDAFDTKFRIYKSRYEDQLKVLTENFAKGLLGTETGGRFECKPFLLERG